MSLIPNKRNMSKSSIQLWIKCNTDKSSLILVKQPVKKENFEFNPAVLCLKIDLV